MRIKESRGLKFNGAEKLEIPNPTFPDPETFHELP
jgi:hypothetical protein